MGKKRIYWFFIKLLWINFTQWKKNNLPSVEIKNAVLFLSPRSKSWTHVGRRSQTCPETRRWGHHWLDPSSFQARWLAVCSWLWQRGPKHTQGLFRPKDLRFISLMRADMGNKSTALARRARRLAPVHQSFSWLLIPLTCLSPLWRTAKNTSHITHEAELQAIYAKLNKGPMWKIWGHLKVT